MFELKRVRVEGRPFCPCTSVIFFFFSDAGGSLEHRQVKSRDDDSHVRLGMQCLGSRKPSLGRLSSVKRQAYCWLWVLLGWDKEKAPFDR